MIFCTRNPSNKKQGLYHRLHVPTQPWEIISMDFLGVLLTTHKGHDYLFVVFDRFRKMSIIMPCKKTIKGKKATHFFFEYVWVNFGIPRRIIS
jgi:hypothetical protein